jgi:hypothetical protein
MTLSARIFDFAKAVAGDVKSLTVRILALEARNDVALDLQRARVLIQTQRIAAQQILKAGL